MVNWQYYGMRECEGKVRRCQSVKLPRLNCKARFMTTLKLVQQFTQMNRPVMGGLLYDHGSVNHSAKQFVDGMGAQCERYRLGTAQAWI